MCIFSAFVFSPSGTQDRGREWNGNRGSTKSKQQAGYQLEIVLQQDRFERGVEITWSSISCALVSSADPPLACARPSA